MLQEDRFEVRVSKWELGWFLAGSILFGLIALVIAWLAAPGDRGRVAAWVSTSICAVAASVASWRLFRRDPILVISDAGIEHRGHGVGIIPWSDVDAAGIRVFRGSSVLTLTVRDRAAPVSRRRLYGTRQPAGVVTVSIRLWGLVQSPEDVFREVQRRRQRC